MPWDPDDQFNIIKYLGMPFTSKSKTTVDAKQDAITDDELIEMVQAYIAELQTLEADIATQRDTASTVFAQLKTEARKYAINVAKSLGLEVAHDVF